MQNASQGAGPLAGAGGLFKSTYGMGTNHASIGGGGGWGYSTSATGTIQSGRGGEGCVVIQYIP